MSDLKIINKFEVLSTDTGEITEIFDNTIPIKQRIDGIGYIKSQVESRIDLIKQRIKDLTLDRKLLEDLINELKELTIKGILNSDDNIARGLETKAYISERTSKTCIVDEKNVPDDQLEYTITVKGLSDEKKTEIYGLIWQEGKINTDDIKITSKVNVNRLSSNLVRQEKKTIVSFSRAGAVINE